MSLNESISEPPEEDAGLPDLYRRELKRRKNISYSNGENNSQGKGGYSEWKARNGVTATSERMVSSLGRAIHNHGVITLNDSDTHEAENNPGYQSNFLPSTEYNARDKERPRLNSSEPCYTPHRFINRQHSREVACDNDGVEYSNGVYEHQYNYSNKGGSEVEFSSEENKCGGMCCSNQSQLIQSPMNQESHHTSYNGRERHLVNNIKSKRTEHPQNDYHCHNMVQNKSQTVNQTPPFVLTNQHLPHHNFVYTQCHQPQPVHQCCQNEPPRSSPHKKCTVNHKTEMSIKKLYRILWLQNEQLGLLERQVSKLIEVNFNKETDSKVDGEDDSLANKECSIKKVETCEVGTMTDLPCLKCSSNEKKSSSSESEPEICKKDGHDESLTLYGVEIPVSEEDISSPPVSMHIDMKEFQESSSSQTDESDTTEDESEPVGWTFYDNVVGQVNNILKSAKKKPTKKKKKHGCYEDINLAMEQLKRLGIGKSEAEMSHAKRVTFEQGLKEQQINLRAQSEISMNFNALASKYLTSGAKVQDISMCNLITSNTNMSMATMRYLERHQITNNEMEGLAMKNKGMKLKKSRSNGEKAVTSKFLDITAIRQQPKLLPKDI